MTRRFLVVLAAGTALSGGFASSALANGSFGQHVATCAHPTLGQRDNPPAVAGPCHPTMTFANFGAMAQHMQGAR